MKSFIVVFALVALSTAFPGEEPKSAESTKQKRGLVELAHAPVILPAAPYPAKSLATPIIHAGPVVTKVFEAPPAPLVRGYDTPIVTGPLITRGYGPHIYGAAKAILPAPIPAPIYTAPILKAPIYTAPLISKSILAPTPIISYAPKYAAPLALSAYHGW